MALNRIEIAIPKVWIKFVNDQELTPAPNIIGWDSSSRLGEDFITNCAKLKETYGDALTLENASAIVLFDPTALPLVLAEDHHKIFKQYHWFENFEDLRHKDEFRLRDEFEIYLKKHRGIKEELFKINSNNKLIPITQEETIRLAESLLKRGRADLYVEMRRLVFVIMARLQLGFRPEDREIDFFVELEAKRARTWRPNAKESKTSRELAASWSSRAVIDETVGSTDRRSKIALILTNYGHDTLAVALTWAWGLISSNSLHEKARFEIASASDSLRVAWVKNALLEAFRLYPPIWIFTRWITNEIRINDIRLPAQKALLMPLYFMFRHEKFCVNPLKYDPDRFAKSDGINLMPSFLPFGKGPRSCQAAQLSMQIGVAILGILLERFSSQLELGRLPDPLPGLFLFPEGGMPTKFTG
jgi:hypothetical protein